MLLITHIIIALTGLVVSGLLLASPSRTKLYLNYALLIATLTTGSCLIISTGHGLVSFCATGLAYSLVTLGSSLLARRRLASQQL
ncbi:MAG TPA: hypothetical protein VFK03_01145 [Candidatus Saccharimonadales bacterium]|nr:hypothetical protein [Candidatus Saccharimonadales bacterium]